MSIQEDKLYKKVTDRYKWFEDEAKKHRRLNRILWLGASIISVLVAITAAFDFTIFNVIKSRQISVILALILPLVTGYVVLRTPEKLWILETSIRNRLKDLSVELEFQFERNPKFNRQDFEKKYLALMAESNDKWVDIKRGAG
ncbi:hypothetical protein IH879_17625 [candidate division KSB1 bacterium]|nr:hypothetical protein [candidate division KSB1 bacterium]